ncbi:putative membrane protein [Campylobacter lari]|uniref:hypothetical protein n=2 Tax=Campylobacter lari TaxID=201 RepID=UPI00215390A1|nr:hypothetical protein [Campylobacter lari]MCR6565518.1 hypothetical protein [Campylobacter lari]
MKLIKSLKNKIIFSQTSFDISMVLAIFSPIFIVPLLLCLSDLEENSINQIATIFIFVWLYIAFVLALCLKEEFEKLSYDFFILKFNKTLEIELKYELEKINYSIDINAINFISFALIKCKNDYEKGKIDKDFINKTKEYYIKLFKKLIAEELKLQNKDLILKSNQNEILKIIQDRH